MTYPGLSMLDGSSKIYYWIFGSLSVGGCGGHSMRPKLNLKDKGQMFIANEHTDMYAGIHKLQLSIVSDFF